MEPDVDPYAPTTPGARPPLPEESAPTVAGRTIGEYVLQRELGRGGMGVVYLARDPALDREVALKVLQPRLARDAEFERRFIREARTAAKLDHPNIVQVYTAGRSGDVLYMAMQVVKGETLDAFLKRRRRLPAREAVDIIRQAARALQAAHEASLIHRDVKPTNIMIDAAGRVKLMDFGLMRSRRDADAITEPGVFYGTPEYASPEQCETSEFDGRADLYSLGAVFYELLTGRRPHAGDTPLALFKKILEEPPVPVRTLSPDVPPAVVRLVERMMAKRPDDRPATAAEVVEAADAILAGQAPPARRPAWAVLGLLLLGAGLIAAGAVWRSAPPAPPAAGPVEAVGKLRVVVFDLKNGLPRPESAWVSIALSDLLIAALSRQDRLDVPTRDVLLWKLKEMEQAGKATEDNRRVLTGELGAGAYLSGTYYVQGGRLRLTLAGYRLPESAQMFPAMAFDGSESDLLGLVDQAAAAVARALLGGGDAVAANTAPRDGLKKLQEKAAEAPPPPQDKPAAMPPAPATTAPSGAAAERESRRLAGGDLRQRKQEADRAVPDDLTRAWYENRKALEAAKLRKEDFEVLAAQLHRALRPDEGAADEKAKARPDLPRLEFACPSCGTVAPRFGRCAPCGRTLVVKLPKK
jgi:TolB-like protein